MNPDFSVRYSDTSEWVTYKGKLALFVINNKPVVSNSYDNIRYQTLRVQAIKSIYITLNPQIKT